MQHNAYVAWRHQAACWLNSGLLCLVTFLGQEIVSIFDGSGLDSRDQHRFRRGLLSQCTRVRANSTSNPEAVRPRDWTFCSQKCVWIVLTVNKPWQISLNHNYNMTFSISPAKRAILIDCPQNVSKWVTCVSQPLLSWSSFVNYRVRVMAYSRTSILETAYTSTQWETALLRKAMSHWPGTYREWSLLI